MQLTDEFMIRQIDSSIREGRFLGEPVEMVFIRAPKIERTGKDVKVIATEGDDPVLVQKGQTLLLHGANAAQTLLFPGPARRCASTHQGRLL